jgi:uncharacterized membrane protein
MLAAAYYVTVTLLAPISFGPLQLRVASLLVPIILLNRRYASAIAIGVMLANVWSPFGWYDWLIMPLISYTSYMIAYRLRGIAWLALLLSAAVVAIGVAIFPLYLGGGIPIWPTVLLVFVPQAALYLVGWYGIWRHFPINQRED